MRRRRKQRGSELTPLIDVLFIMLFASLVQARGVVQGQPDEPALDPVEPVDAGSPPAPPDAALPDALPDAAPGAEDAAVAAQSLHGARSRAAAEALARTVQDKSVFIVEVTGGGYVVGVTRWLDGQPIGRESLKHRLVREVPASESDFELEYRGDAEEQHRLCAIVQNSFDPALPDLNDALVLITADEPYENLIWALRQGLEKDGKRCFNGLRGLAILIRPAGNVDESPESP